VKIFYGFSLIKKESDPCSSVDIFFLTMGSRWYTYRSV
jgi:hypothetical protein